MLSKTLQEQRSPIVKTIYRLRDLIKERDFTPDEEAEFKRASDELTALDKRIEAAKRAEALEALETRIDNGEDIGREDIGDDAETRDGDRGRTQAGSESRRNDEDRALCLQAWMRHGAAMDLTKRHEEACERQGFNPTRRAFDVRLSDTETLARVQRAWRNEHRDTAPERAAEIIDRESRERRDLSAVTGSSGAFTVPTTFVNRLEVNLLAFGGMMQVAEILRTDGGEDMPMPTADDTSNKGERLGEGASQGSSVDPTFGQFILGAYKYHSKLIKVPSELLEDSAFNLNVVLPRMLAERLARIFNEEFTVGTGVNSPQGITIGSTLGVTAADVAEITADEVIALEHSVDPSYRPGSSFMFHDTVLEFLRKLKDGEGRYLWSAGLRGGAPDTLNGRRLTINQDMATRATGAITMLFGQMMAYKIRQVRTVRFVRLVERYADTDQVGFDVFSRADGGLLDLGTAPVTNLTQA